VLGFHNVAKTRVVEALRVKVPLAALVLLVGSPIEASAWGYAGVLVAAFGAGNAVVLVDLVAQGVSRQG
jgi:hypothetical protein